MKHTRVFVHLIASTYRLASAVGSITVAPPPPQWTSQIQQTNISQTVHRQDRGIRAAWTGRLGSCCETPLARPLLLPILPLRLQEIEWLDELRPVANRTLGLRPPGTNDGAAVMDMDVSAAMELGSR